MIESAFGLGDALVSGRINADHFVVDARDGRIEKREIAYKQIRIVPTAEGTRKAADLIAGKSPLPPLHEAAVAIA